MSKKVALGFWCISSFGLMLLCHPRQDTGASSVNIVLSSGSASVESRCGKADGKRL